jgi:hypothetical protein
LAVSSRKMAVNRTLAPVALPKVVNNEPVKDFYYGNVD